MPIITLIISYVYLLVLLITQYIEIMSDKEFKDSDNIIVIWGIWPNYSAYEYFTVARHMLARTIRSPVLCRVTH